MYKAIFYGLGLIMEIETPTPFYKFPFTLDGKNGEIIYLLYDLCKEERIAIYAIDSCMPPLNSEQLKSLGQRYRGNMGYKDGYEDLP